MRRYSSDIFKPKFYPKPDFTKVDFAELPPPEPKPDYSVVQYPWPKDHYKNNQPFFTKDSIDSFVRLKDLSNHLPNDADETPIGLPQKRNKSNETARQILNDLIRENEEFYANLMEEAKQNVTYQDGTEEINEAFRDTIPALEIGGAIDDVKDTEPEEINQAIENARQDCTIIQNQALPQPEIDSQANPVNEEVSAANQPYDNSEDYTNQAPDAVSETPEMTQDQMMPLANEVMGDSMMQQQNLEQIVQEEQQGMMEDPSQGAIFAPEYFGL